MAFQMAGIDVSHWQGKIDFNKVRDAGIRFVIIKAGGSDAGMYTDVKFTDYYNAAKQAGLHVGAYYFAGKSFYQEGMGISQANHFLRILNGKIFDMPVYLDIEMIPKGKRIEATNQAIAFGDCIETHNGFFGIYSSDIAGFENMVQKTRLERFTWWVARYGGRPVNHHGIHQWTSSGRINGIKGKVDRDTCYVNFPKIIKQRGLNMFYGF